MLRREHDEQARRHIATVMTGGDDEGGGGVNLRAVCLVRAIVVCVWVELLLMWMMEMVVGDGGVVDAEWMREVEGRKRKKDIGAGATSQSLVQQRAFQHS